MASDAASAMPAARGRSVQEMDQPTATAISPWFAPVREMLKLEDYAFPLAAAQSQFRERFYGLNAAALLEDIYVDALENFTRKYSPSTAVERAPRGEKSFDYSVAGTPVSHKVGLGVTQIAVLWDATQRIETWSAPQPLVYHLTDRAMRKRTVSVEGLASAIADGAYVRALHDTIPRERAARAARCVLVVHWPPASNRARILAVMPLVASSETLRDAVEFSALWSVVASALNQHGVPANEIDVLLFRSTRMEDVSVLTAGLHLQIEPGLRSGVYGLNPLQMQDIQLTRNNRAQLIPEHTVAGFLMGAEESSRFVPLPTWIAPYAASRPPSLYLTQSQAFRQLFE